MRCTIVSITATELKNNLSKYLKQAQTEDNDKKQLKDGRIMKK
jgi:hypothetical protein